MSLAILSKKLESQKDLLANIVLTILNANLYLAIHDSALKSNDSIQDIEIRKYFGRNENDFEYFLLDIQEKDWSTNIFNNGTFTKDGIAYYLLAGTDNTPLKLSYYFSLNYLRIEPSHKIALYDECIFGLEEIERIEKETGYVENWDKLIGR